MCLQKQGAECHIHIHSLSTCAQFRDFCTQIFSSFLANIHYLSNVMEERWRGGRLVQNVRRSLMNSQSIHFNKNVSISQGKQCLFYYYYFKKPFPLCALYQLLFTMDNNSYIKPLEVPGEIKIVISVCFLLARLGDSAEADSLFSSQPEEGTNGEIQQTITLQLNQNQCFILS